MLPALAEGVSGIVQNDHDGFHIWPKGRGAEEQAERREEAPPVTFEVEAESLEPAGVGFGVRADRTGS